MLDLLETYFVEIIYLVNSFFFLETFLSNLFGHTADFPKRKPSLKVITLQQFQLLKSVFLLFSHDSISILLFGMYNCNQFAVEFEMTNYQDNHNKHFVEANEQTTYPREHLHVSKHESLISSTLLVKTNIGNKECHIVFCNTICFLHVD